MTYLLRVNASQFVVPSGTVPEVSTFFYDATRKHEDQVELSYRTFFFAFVRPRHNSQGEIRLPTFTEELPASFPEDVAAS